MRQPDSVRASRVLKHGEVNGITAFRRARFLPCIVESQTFAEVSERIWAQVYIRILRDESVVGVPLALVTVAL